MRGVVKRVLLVIAPPNRVLRGKSFECNSCISCTWRESMENACTTDVPLTIDSHTHSTTHKHTHTFPTTDVLFPFV